MAATISAAGLSGCRHPSDVERHFLRMPAECAGGLSGIERARWLKDSRDSLPDRKVLRASGFLSLPATRVARGIALHGMKVLYVAGDDVSGGLATVTLSGSHPADPARLHLLEHRKFCYIDVTDRVLGPQGTRPTAWGMAPDGHSITGFRVHGRAGGQPVLTSVAEVSWTGAGWSLRRLP